MDEECPAGRNVLVRVRGVLATNGSLSEDAGFLKTNVPLKEAKLAVRSQAGKQLAFAVVAHSGRASLFTAPGCVPS